MRPRKEHPHTANSSILESAPCAQAQLGCPPLFYALEAAMGKLAMCFPPQLQQIK